MILKSALKTWFWGSGKRRLRRKSGFDSLYGAWCAAECLESRALLSNVAVTFNSGLLRMEGDAGDHQVAAAVSGSNLQLTGSGGTTLTYQGTTSSSISIALAAIREIDILMQDGNDQISLDATGWGTVSGNICAILGGGTNSFSLQNATVAGHATVMGGSGADTINISNDTLHNLTVYACDGNDNVTLAQVTLSATQVYADLIAAVPSLSSALSGITVGGSLVVGLGSGTDTLQMTSVNAADALLDGLWSISLGTGSDSATLDTVQTWGTTVIAGGTGSQVTTTNSNFGGVTVVAMSGNNAQITVAGSTFEGPAVMSAGVGDSQTIAVNDSTFKSVAEFVSVGSNSKLNLENATAAGSGTTFQGPVVAALPGPSAVANLGNPATTNALVFSSVLVFVGGNPAATVNIATAHTTLDDNQLILISANRVDV